MVKAQATTVSGRRGDVRFVGAALREVDSLMEEADVQEAAGLTLYRAIT